MIRARPGDDDDDDDDTEYRDAGLRRQRDRWVDKRGQWGSLVDTVIILSCFHSDCHIKV